MHDTEEWRSVSGWPGYEVSSRGQVRRSRDGRLLRVRRDAHGWLRVKVSRHGRSRPVAVHRLVCEAFHGPQPTPAHRAWILDGRRHRLQADNVAWMTREERHRDPRTRHHLEGRRLTASEARQIRSCRPAGRIPRGRAAEVAAAFNVSRALVWAIWTGRKWNGQAALSRHDSADARVRMGDEITSRA